MGNCIGNLNAPSAIRETSAIPGEPNSGGSAVEQQIEAPAADLPGASHAAFTITENGRRVALFSNWETKKSLRATDTNGREAGTDAMKKLRIPLPDIGRLGGALASLPAGVELKITGLDQDNLDALAAINLLPEDVRSKISALDLSRSNINDASLAHITGLSQLKSLNLSGCRNFSADGLAHLQGMTTLRSLDVSRCYQLTQQGENPLRFPENLTSLNLSNCHRLTHNDLASLRPLT